MKRTMIAFLLGAAGLASLVGCTSYSGTPATTPTPGRPAPASAWPATPFDCAALADQPATPASLPDGAARITLCNEPGHEIGLQPPADALVADTAAVVAAYNAGEHANLAVMVCTADLGPAYRLVVEYPDDTVIQLRGELYGCRIVGVKTGAQQVFDAFSSALLRQREAHPVTVSDPLQNARCNMGVGPGSWIPAAMGDTVSGFLCPHGETDHPMLISAEDWATVRDDFTANASKEMPTGVDTTTCEQATISAAVGVAASGDTVSLHPVCRGLFELWQGGDDGSLYWQPGPAAADVLGEQRA